MYVIENFVLPFVVGFAIGKFVIYPLFFGRR